MRSEYLGRGEVAELLARMDELERLEAAAEREDERERREAERDADRELDALITETGALAREALEAAGFHYHRGQWRKRRGR